ncbi:MAG: peptidylprolyl isomerase [Pirellulales bacterium]
MAKHPSRWGIGLGKRAKHVAREPWRARFEQLEDRRVLTAPTLAVIPNVTLLSGAPLNIALDGFDADGDTLTFSATSTNASMAAAVSPQTNRSLRISVAHTSSGQPGDSTFSGDMILQLFDDLAPRTTGRIGQLAGQGFYNGLIFHRVMDHFMIQGGDPLGTGTGGSGVKFDDEFNAALQFTGPGVLAMANSGDDTNDSQFFITDLATRHLDFNHSIFGFLTQGDDVRNKISDVPTDPANNYRPLSNVVMQSVSVFVDKENGVLRLSAPTGYNGQADVTVTANDGHGGTAQRTFHVTIQPDTNNNVPFVLPVPDIRTTVDTPVTFTIPAMDVDSGTIYYDAATNPNLLDLTYTRNQLTGEVALTPKNGLVGVQPVLVGVTADGSTWDTQMVPLLISPKAPASVTLVASSDTGASNSDRLTNLNNSAGRTLQFQVSGVLAGAEVTLYDGATVLGQAVASGTSVTITTNATATLADGLHAITAKQTLKNLPVLVGNRTDSVDLASAVSPAVNVTIDARAPGLAAGATLVVNGGAAQRSAITSLAIHFDENVSASLGGGDLTLRNDTTGTVVIISAVVPAYNAVTNTAIWNLSGVALADGYYTATLLAAGVTDPAGNSLAEGNRGFQFFRLQGDTDGNAAVDIFDVAKVQTSYGGTGGPAEGDFNGDGSVNIFDVAILQTQYGKTLTPPAPAPAAMPAAESSGQGTAASGQGAADAKASRVGEAYWVGETPAEPAKGSGVRDQGSGIGTRRLVPTPVSARPTPTHQARRHPRMQAAGDLGRGVAGGHSASHTAWEAAVDQWFERQGAQ